MPLSMRGVYPIKFSLNDDETCPGCPEDDERGGREKRREDGERRGGGTDSSSGEPGEKIRSKSISCSSQILDPELNQEK